MNLEYALNSALSMRSFVQYVQFLISQTSNSTSNTLANQLKSQPQTNLMPYLYNPYSSFATSSTTDINQRSDDYHHHHHSKLTPVPENTKDDLQTSGLLILLFLFVFLLKSRGIKVSLIAHF